MSNTQQSSETPDLLVQSPLVVNSWPPNSEIDILDIRPLEPWQIQAINSKASQIEAFFGLSCEIKKTVGTTKKIEHGTDLYSDCLKV